MSIERRLQHAARELREVRIEVPPLGIPNRAPRRPRLQAVAAPLLFVAGGVLALGVMQGRVTEPNHTDIPAAPTIDEVGPTPVEAITAQVPAPSVRAELEMIRRSSRPTSPQPDAPPSQDPAAPAAPVESQIEVIGPI